jgi:DNA repair exonuclease SbcCD nuclease subunit
MMARFIHTADWHIWDKHKYNFFNKRFNKLIENAHKIVDYAIEKKVDVFIVAGDIFHTPNPDENLMKYCAAIVARLLKEKIRVRLLVGNHDSDGLNHSLESLESYLYYLEPSDMLKIISNKNKKYDSGDDVYIHSEVIRGVKYIYVPYQKNIYRALSKARDKRNLKKLANVLVVHGSTKEAFTSTDYKLKNAEIDKEHLRGYSYVALGDFHRAQEVGDDLFKKTNEAYYSGSIIRMDWGERNDEKSFNYVRIYKGGKSKAVKQDINVIPLDDIEMIKLAIPYKRIDKWIRYGERKGFEEIKGRKVKGSLIKIFIRGAVKGKYERKAREFREILYKYQPFQVYITASDKKKEEGGSEQAVKSGLNPVEAVSHWSKAKEISLELTNYGREIIEELHHGRK